MRSILYLDNLDIWMILDNWDYAERVLQVDKSSSDVLNQVFTIVVTFISN